jgi:anaerobic selenocysteine-containing dehydrogenase/Fe-S-cluster-containing dehydrogenase component
MNDSSADKKKDGITRRKFLQILGATSAATMVGCADPQEQTLYPRVKNDDGHIPGVAQWYSSTCTECSAGCGINIKNVDGRIIKVEGNREHPLNRGGLCALGQASLQHLYDPDRVREPLKKVLDNSGNETFKPISWDEALDRIGTQLKEKGRGNAIITGEVSGALEELLAEWGKSLNADHLVYDVSSQAALEKAAELVYGVSGVPTYSIDKAEVVVNFGADFLETWISPCEFARDWSLGRRAKKPLKLIHVEPRLSLTGANADLWLQANPGTETLLALGILKQVLETGRLNAVIPELQPQIQALTKDISLERVSGETGVAVEKILVVVEQLTAAKKSLVIAGGTAASTLNPLPLHTVVNLLNVILGNVGETVHIGAGRTSRTSLDKISELIKKLQKEAVNVLVVAGTNPAFTLPTSFEFPYAAKKAKLIVSFSSHLDETAKLADLILPAHTGLESWGDSRPIPGVYGIIQPAMAPVFNTKHLGDILIATAKGAGVTAASAGPDETFLGFLKESWKKIHAQYGAGKSFDEFWRTSVEKGGFFETSHRYDRQKIQISPAVFQLKYENAAFAADGANADDIIVYPYFSVKSFDGRSANRPWLQELPDPITQLVWDSWGEVHPDTAKRFGVAHGEMLTIRNHFGEINVPAYVTKYVHRGIIAVPVGQGHSSYGRFADSIGGGNVLELLPPVIAEGAGSIALASARAAVKKGAAPHVMVSTSGSDSQHDRELARTKYIDEAKLEADETEHAKEHEPKQMYKQREHPLYEWAMSVDLAACTGCSACVVACYAENNIPVVGKHLCDQGREMSWLRIERYLDEVEGQELKVSYLPMMCQQCHNAPCEPVCPVYATYHNEEGLNVMVYNRCVGTRYCSNNCSYKVRRFNFLQIDVPEPLNWQLNPDVTRRSMGVMEKCTFCMQRIMEAKDHAKDEGRMVRDGEIQPACVQSCPTEALVFGNMNDPQSKVAARARNGRAYKVLDAEINTQPAVSYLEDIRYRI